MEIRRERRRILYELKLYRETSTWLGGKLTQAIKEFNVADTQEEKDVKSSELGVYMAKSRGEIKNLKKYLTDLKKTGRIYYIPANKRKHIDEIISTFDK